MQISVSNISEWYIQTTIKKNAFYLGRFNFLSLILKIEFHIWSTDLWKEIKFQISFTHSQETSLLENTM